MDREGISGEIQNVIERQGYHIAPLEVVREEVGNGFGYQLADLSQIPIGYDSVALGHTQSIKDPIRLSERTYSTFFIYKKGTYAIDWIMPLNDSGDEYQQIGKEVGVKVDS